MRYPATNSTLPKPAEDQTQGERDAPSKSGFEIRFTPQVGELVAVDAIVVVMVVETV